jgi:hypothetical protein
MGSSRLIFVYKVIHEHISSRSSSTETEEYVASTVTDDDGPAFAHFPESVSHVVPLEDAAVVAIVAIVAIVAVVAVVVLVVAVADAVIESPVVVVLLRATPSSTPSLVAPPSLSSRRAPLVLVGCCITSSLIAPPSLSPRLIVESPPLSLHRRRPSLVAPSLSRHAAPAGCCIAASLHHWMAAGG